MRHKREKPDRLVFAFSQGARKLFSGGWSGCRTLVPIPANEPYQRYRRPIEPRVPLPRLWIAWLQYHYTQLRWDIERGVARLLHRRWV
ncbi:hypothetical protein EPA93_35820 [Ktedonosporobacter rubrisoli]|uniref:Uncharacterized protein n=1 Tax=Ktedonosporobacter rubrisoli TaxID=2509675 RepID=A0A4P6JZV7_KTERU|nr:hypothetical protein [Ktedonosporobacter rubrisoli]QBD81053.1 hypothetical protein EPA93_35820 [Ktedonosporobacter rubrisoli]